MNKKSLTALCNSVLVLSLVFSSNLNVAAMGNDAIDSEILSYSEIDVTEIKKIETNDKHLHQLLLSIDATDGLDEAEVAQISKVSDIDIETYNEDDLQITDYILEPKEPLATITREDGTVEYMNESVTYRSIVKDLGWVGNQKVVSNVTVAATTKYFYYDLGSGRTVKKLYETEVTLTGSTGNLSKLQMNTYATGLATFDENGNELQQRQETRTGSIYNVSGSGPYYEYTGTNYYYPAYQSNTSVYVTIVLTLSNNTTSSFNVKVI